MDEQTYIEERVDDQMEWLSNKSQFNQRRYKRIRTIVILLSVLIPFASGYMTGNDFDTQIKIAVGAAGVLIALLEGIEGMNKYQENWVSYRAAAETLKREKNLFLTRSGEYEESETPFQDFVLRVESILNDENSKWSRYIKTKAKA